MSRLSRWMIVASGLMIPTLALAAGAALTEQPWCCALGSLLGCCG